MVLTVGQGERGYDVIVERGAILCAGEYLDLDRRALIVTDEGVPRGYAEAVAEVCREPSVLILPMGEGTKSLESFEAILTKMLDEGFTRGDCVVAVGGGVVGDLAGFAASAYMRGVDFYNVPTTSLSQIDSSIGGKTAVNLCGVKNAVGAFYRPRRVLIDPGALQTLPPRHMANGLCEALKMAATCDAELFSIFERGLAFERTDEITVRALTIKKRVVEADEREAGLRRVLNFGHTIGHGVESACAGRLLHGECVALGMLPMCSREAAMRVRRALSALGLPVRFDGVPKDAVKAALRHDKKGYGEGVCAVVVDEIGDFRFERMTYEALSERLDEYIESEAEK